jgi:hypothetical protein
VAINAESSKQPGQISVGSVASEILNYIRDHPSAEDTLEGVIEWWLLETRIRHTNSEVKAALEELVALSLVRVQRHQDGRSCYRANPTADGTARNGTTAGSQAASSENDI